MTTLLRELEFKATSVTDSYPAGCNGYPAPVYGFDREKFAELVMQECVSWINANVGLITAEAATDLKTHLGLEK